jgi:hypothetical protein
MKLRPRYNPTPRVHIGRDPRLRALSIATDFVGDVAQGQGFVATPEMGIKDMLARAGTKGPGGDLNIFLSAGTWTFNKGISIDRQRVHFWGVPGETIFERTSDDGTPMLTLNEREITLNGIRFNDTAETTAACVKVIGGRCAVRKCIFDDCFRVLELNGGQGQQVLENYVIASRDTVYAVHGTNGSADGIFSMNVFESTTAGTAVFFDDLTLRWTFVGNQMFNQAASIDYRGADGHVGAGNCPSTAVTVR